MPHHKKALQKSKIIERERPGASLDQSLQVGAHAADTLLFVAQRSM
jgi:hypothetical protein